MQPQKDRKKIKKMRRNVYILGLLFVIVLGACSKDEDSGGPRIPPSDVFKVTVATKTDAHPNFNRGDQIGFVINGVEGPELTLDRGVTYEFSVTTGRHPFYISTSSIGASEGQYTDGVVNDRITSGIMEFTPSEDAPDLLYYQCYAHPYMGYIIRIEN